MAAGCRQAMPVADAAPALAHRAEAVTANGRISGSVRGPAGRSAIEGRRVQVVNVDTNERQHATTNEAGGFTFTVKPGTYRVDVTLRDGEVLLKRPGTMEVSRSDLEAQAEFVVAPRGGSTSRPRGPTYQLDPGLGSPIA